jgi:hypothetical protein
LEFDWFLLRFRAAQWQMVDTGIKFMYFKSLIITSVAVLASLALSVTAQTTGTVFGWGQNGSGQANPVGTLSGIQAIAAGSDDTTPNSIGFSLGLQLNGTITGWGSYPTNNYGTIYYTAIAAGEYHAVGLSIDGKVYAWGNNASHQTNVPSILSSNVIAIAAGSSGTDLTPSGTSVAPARRTCLRVSATLWPLRLVRCIVWRCEPTGQWWPGEIIPTPKQMCRQAQPISWPSKPVISTVWR